MLKFLDTCHLEQSVARSEQKSWPKVYDLICVQPGLHLGDFYNRIRGCKKGTSLWQPNSGDLLFSLRWHYLREDHLDKSCSELSIKAEAFMGIPHAQRKFHWCSTTGVVTIIECVAGRQWLYMCVSARWPVGSRACIVSFCLPLPFVVALVTSAAHTL